ncbi:MAG: hypothetical protein ACXVI7_08470 [Halobacteriota archaeon]
MAEVADSNPAGPIIVRLLWTIGALKTQGTKLQLFHWWRNITRPSASYLFPAAAMEHLSCIAQYCQ